MFRKKTIYEAKFRAKSFVRYRLIVSVKRLFDMCWVLFCTIVQRILDKKILQKLAKLKSQLVISYHKRVYHKVLKVKTQDPRSVMNKT